MKTFNTSVAILGVFLCLSATMLSQNTAIDSLKIELQNHKEKDSIRVNILNELAFSYYRKDMTKTVEYIEESHAIAEKIDYKKGKGKSLYIKGITQVVQSNLDEALLNFQEALQLYETSNFKKGLSECYNGMGIIYYYKSDQQQAIHYYSRSVKIDEEIGNKKGVSSGLMNIGNVYSELANFEKAIRYYTNALSIKIELKDQQGISNCYNNIGTVYDDQANYPLALEFYNKSLTINEKIKDTLGMSKSLNNIGVIYKNYEKYDKAIAYYTQSLNIEKKIGSERNIASALNNLGVVYYRKEDFKTALEFLQDALIISTKINDKDNVSRCLNNIGDIYLQLNDNIKAYDYYIRAKDINLLIDDKLGLCNSYLGIAMIFFNQKKYDESLDNALKSKEISDKLGLISYHRDVSELLSKIYKNKGNYKKALVSYQEFKILNDSIFNQKKSEKLSQLEYEYKYQKALDSASINELKLTKTIEATNKDLEKSQRNYLWAIISFLLISIFFGSIIFFQKLRNEKSKTQNIAMEQKLLRLQMTPHFIFNSLSVLQGMILNKEEKKSVHYLSKFSKLLRITLENSRDQSVSLSQELMAIQNYLTLQNLENEAYKCTILVEDSIDIALFEIPPMLIQPFVENAIEHAFATQTENKIIDIRLTYKNGKLICTITDNGIGIDHNTDNRRKEKKSLATTITAERLKVLSNDFKMKGSVTIEDRYKYNQNGTIVTMVIPHKIIRES